MKLSGGFVSALIGLSVTIFSWYGPWSWPAWPALGAMAILFGSHTSFADLPNVARAAVIVFLIALNSACWAVAAIGLWWLAKFVARLLPRFRAP